VRDWAAQTTAAATTLEGILRKGRQQSQDIQASALRIRLVHNKPHIPSPVLTYTLKTRYTHSGMNIP
jgi:hypothetical protein